LRAAGAEFAQGQAIERYFNDVLGFWARDKNVRRDLKFQAPEFLLASEVLRRLAIGSARQKREESARLVIADFMFRMGVEPGAVAAERVEEEQLRSQRERCHICFAELRDPLFKRGADDHVFESERRTPGMHAKATCDGAEGLSHGNYV
jgi:hypothetical protein